MPLTGRARGTNKYLFFSTPVAHCRSDGRGKRTPPKNSAGCATKQRAARRRSTRLHVLLRELGRRRLPEGARRGRVALDEPRGRVADAGVARREDRLGCVVAAHHIQRWGPLLVVASTGGTNPLSATPALELSTSLVTERHPDGVDSDSSSCSIVFDRGHLLTRRAIA